MAQHKDAASLFLSQSFVSQLLFMTVFTVNLLYQIQVVGLNAFQLVLVGTILELTVFLFEIPTGLIADYKGRKFSIVLGYFLIGIGFFIEGLFPLFTTVLISQIVWGIGYTCISGALQAWISDEAGLDRVDKIFINSAKYENAGSFIGIPLAVIIGYYSLQASILTGAIGFLLLAIYLWAFMGETTFLKKKRDHSQSSIHELKSMFSGVLASFGKNAILRYCLIISFIAGVYSEGFDRLWVAHLTTAIKEAFLTDENMIFIVGGLQFITSILTIMVFEWFSRMSEKLSFRSLYKSLLISYAILILTLLGFAFSTSIYGLILLFLLIQVNRQVMSTFENIWFNKLITDSSKRATFFSIKGQVDAIGQIGGGPVTGIISLHSSIKAALAASAVLLTPILFIYHRLLKTRG
ncbi:MFS transporter [Peribacillus deserti]|uniref:Major facilitator superfamily (MFS) profile domain-containing protein n=1 Tax=Peribacillus deserti TaxID=673318 RepID=A0A2N5M8G2_9BACI|nr:MFS transporter [Peribacillus deserti]PLT30622.1 hypothetical protein CUU66_06610 [Peribacillus deserti]